MPEAREVIPAARMAALPSTFHTLPIQAHEYQLAFITVPVDPEAKKDAQEAFVKDVLNQQLVLNVEYKNQGQDMVNDYKKAQEAAKNARVGLSPLYKSRGMRSCGTMSGTRKRTRTDTQRRY
ncbi:nuclease domain-containing protein [Branchiostoma belcheri]|nr:nuclease domain-containing protein [Branchiostoma belcheri]